MKAEEEQADKRPLREIILDEYKNGKIVIATPEGIGTAIIDEFIKQPIEGILYDLNRSEAVVLAFVDDPKWINDYAVCKTIQALHSKLTESQREVERLKSLLKECLPGIMIDHENGWDDYTELIADIELALSNQPGDEKGEG